METQKGRPLKNVTKSNVLLGAERKSLSEARTRHKDLSDTAFSFQGERVFFCLYPLTRNLYLLYLSNPHQLCRGDHVMEECILLNHGKSWSYQCLSSSVVVGEFFTKKRAIAAAKKGGFCIRACPQGKGQS